MRHTRIARLLLAILIAGTLTAAYAADSNISETLERWWSRIERTSPRMGVRDLFAFALEATGNSWRADRVEKALGLAEQMQDRDPESPTYGNFKWYWEAEKPVDRNAVEFCMQHAVLLWSQFKERLTPGSVERLERLFRFSVEGIRGHRVPESYTNIFLMKTWNAIAIGEATGRPDLADEGYQMLDRWLMFTWENGIHEYGSPTYYGVDLDSLGLIARFAQRQSGRQAAEAALRLFWTDIAANWFPPCARQGGAHSRDYDYLTGHGYLDRHLQIAGWIQSDRELQQRVFHKFCRWEPPSDLRDLFERRVPRVVHQRWCADQGKRATHFVGHHFSIGSAGANYGPMDKPLVVNLAGGPRMPVINFFMDGRDDPYAKKKIPQGASGHYKALHLTPFIASVQRGPEVLMLAATDVTQKASWRHAAEPACFLSHLILPDEPEVWIGDQVAQLEDANDRVPIPPGQALFLRHNTVAVGIRWVLTRDTSGKLAPVELVNDGSKYNARRITCRHSAEKLEGTGLAALWVRVAEGLDDHAFEVFRKTFSSAETKVRSVENEIEISARGQETTLRLHVDLRTQQRLAVEGAAPGSEKFLFAVDSDDLGRTILRAVDCVARYQRTITAAREGAPESLRAGTIIEAEKAHLIISPLQKDTDESASGKQFLWIPGEPGVGGGGRSAQANWFVHVPEAGEYSLWGRVRTPTQSDDSFYIQFNQNGQTILPRTDWHTGVHRTWEWIAFRIGKERAVPRIPLERGAVEIQCLGREDGAKLDAILLTADPDWQPSP